MPASMHLAEAPNAITCGPSRPPNFLKLEVRSTPNRQRDSELLQQAGVFREELQTADVSRAVLLSSTPCVWYNSWTKRFTPLVCHGKLHLLNGRICTRPSIGHGRVGMCSYKSRPSVMIQRFIKAFTCLDVEGSQLFCQQHRNLEMKKENISFNFGNLYCITNVDSVAKGYD